MQVTQKFWAVADAELSSAPGKFTLRLFNWDPSGVSDYLLLRKEPYEITIDLPEESALREMQANQVREQIKKIQAEAGNAITLLTERLNSILAIEG